MATLFDARIVLFPEQVLLHLTHGISWQCFHKVVVLDEDSSVTENDVVTHLKSTLANFKVAKNVHFVKALPRNTMGKVQKNLLRKQYDTGVK